jgi:hypothetical protein
VLCRSVSVEVGLLAVWLASGLTTGLRATVVVGRGGLVAGLDGAPGWRISVLSSVGSLAAVVVSVGSGDAAASAGVVRSGGVAAAVLVLSTATVGDCSVAPTADMSDMSVGSTASTGAADGMSIVVAPPVVVAVPVRLAGSAMMCFLLTTTIAGFGCRPSVTTARNDEAVVGYDWCREYGGRPIRATVGSFQ